MDFQPEEAGCLTALVRLFFGGMVLLTLIFVLL